MRLSMAPLRRCEQSQLIECTIAPLSIAYLKHIQTCKSGPGGIEEMRKYSLIVENGHRRLYNYMGHSEWDYEAVNKKVSTYSATSKKSAQLSHLTNLPVDPVRHLMTIL